MELIDYFQTFNLYNLSIFILFLFLMDYSGYKLAQIFNISKDFRIVNWLIGTGFFVFIWFILHMFIPFNPIFVALSLSILTLITFILPIKYSFSGLFKNKFELIILIIFLIPFLKISFFRLSLPPRLWDEMAYHFYSPVRLFNETQWNFDSPIRQNQFDFYMMLPRSVDTMYIIIFALTKTYATAQLLHFLIFISTILISSTFVKKMAGKSGAIIFLFTILFLYPELLFDSQIGYIDVATASFAILSLLSLFNFLKKQDVSNMRTAVLFSAIAIGVKYTLLSYIASIWLITIILILFKNKSNVVQIIKSNKSLYISELLPLSIISTIWGGYWYIKNLVYTGNLIYPFSLLCRSCSIGTDKLQGWGYLDFNFQNIPEIIMPLFKNESAFLFIMIFGIFYIFFHKKTIIKKYILLILFTFLLEFLLLSRVGSYTSRFFYHWPIIISMTLSLPFKGVLAFKKKNFSLLFMFFSIFVLTMINFYRTQPIQAKLNSISDNDRWFARGKLSLLDWLKPTIPHMYETVINCGRDHELIKYKIADPNLIWGQYGLTRVYLVNCEYEYIKLKDNAELTYNNIDINLPILSTEECSNQEVTFTNNEMLEFHKLNQMLICERSMTERFTYKK